MKRTVVYEKIARIHQSVDVEYDTEEQLNSAITLADKKCYNIYALVEIFKQNGINVLDINEEYDTNYVDDFEYYDDYESEEEEE